MEILLVIIVGIIIFVIIKNKIKNFDARGYQAEENGEKIWKILETFSTYTNEEIISELKKRSIPYNIDTEGEDSITWQMIGINDITFIKFGRILTARGSGVLSTFFATKYSDDNYISTGCRASDSSDAGYLVDLFYHKGARRVRMT